MSVVGPRRTPRCHVLNPWPGREPSSVEHLAKPPSGAEIVPILQPVYVKSERLRGTAIALSTDGSTMYYLIVPDRQKSSPVWASEGDLTESRSRAARVALR